MDGAPRSATVVAVGTTTCLVLTASDFQPVKERFSEQLQYQRRPWTRMHARSHPLVAASDWYCVANRFVWTLNWLSGLRQP